MTDSSIEAAYPLHEMASLTTEIVAAFVGNNAIAPPDLPNLITSVFTALDSLARPEAPVPAQRPEPAVPIKKSIQQDYLVCLEDGKRVKTLKRYLSTRYGMTPDDYRQRWGLPRDYPMVSPAYNEMRSAMAKRIGLGRKKPAPAPEPEVELELPAAPVTAKRRTAGRKKAPVA
jgi:predicted transcriptional regulator